MATDFAAGCIGGKIEYIFEKNGLYFHRKIKIIEIP